MSGSAGKILKELRLKYEQPGGGKLRQKKLAAMAGIQNHATISKIERGAQNVTGPQAITFARIFNVDPSIFVVPSMEMSSPQGLIEEVEAFNPEPGSFEAQIALKKTQRWYRICNSRLGEIGLSDGAPLIVDNGKDVMADIAIGDVVIAHLCSVGGNSAIKIVRQWIPPYLLITNSRKRNLPSLNLDYDDVSLLGVVVYPQRPKLYQKSFSSSS